MQHLFSPCMYMHAHLITPNMHATLIFFHLALFSHYFQVFDEVTIGFSYLLGFTEICAKLAAMQVVECINSAFTLFDSISDKYDVFKVGVNACVCEREQFTNNLTNTCSFV